MTASLGGHEEFVRLLLENGADINLRGSDGSNALFLASLNGHAGIVRILLENGALPDNSELDGTSALIITARDEIADTIMKRIYAGLNPGQSFSGQVTALISASDSGNLEAVGVRKGKELTSDFLANAEKTTAFIRASRSGHIAILKFMHKKGERPDPRRTEKFTDLMVASMNGHSDVVRLLLEKGANPDLTDKEGKKAADYALNPDIRSMLENNENRQINRR